MERWFYCTLWCLTVVQGLSPSGQKERCSSCWISVVIVLDWFVLNRVVPKKSVRNLLRIAKKVARWWFYFYFLFSPLLGEDFHFDEHIFQMGWFNHHLEGCCWLGFIHVFLVHPRRAMNSYPKNLAKGHQSVISHLFNSFDPSKTATLDWATLT